jgi:hypothetical protein
MEFSASDGQMLADQMVKYIPTDLHKLMFDDNFIKQVKAVEQMTAAIQSQYEVV